MRIKPNETFLFVLSKKKGRIFFKAFREFDKSNDKFDTNGDVFLRRL